MSEKQMVFRFDVDTPVCMNVGVAEILQLMSVYGYPCTFFINMGRSVSWSEIVRKTFSLSNSKTVKPSLPIVRKLGALGLVRTLLLNPRVGCKNLGMIKEIAENGHEIGLHGGWNHGQWQYSACSFSDEDLIRQIEWARRQLIETLNIEPAGFSSPGWNSPANLNYGLQKVGFKYSADMHDSGLNGVYRSKIDDRYVINTNLAGEPGGVGYFEYLVATGKHPGCVSSLFEEAFHRFDQVVVYDHPAFIAKEGRNYLDRALLWCQKKGIDVVTAETMIDRMDYC